MPHTRRNFLGWLAGSLAVYSVGVEPVKLVAEAAHRTDGREPSDSTEPQIAGAQTYVIVNRGDGAMSVHYQLEGSTPYTIEHEGVMKPVRGRRHISTIILPGEELTISAAPMQF